MYDGHAYLKWNPAVELTRQGYLTFAKSQNLAGSSPTNDPLFIGEWSLSPSRVLSCSVVEYTADCNASAGDSAPAEFKPDSDGAKKFYSDFWAEQAAAADKGIGYTFWSYKTQTNDFRWDWSLAVKQGIIPTNVGGNPVTAPWRNNGGRAEQQPSPKPSPTPSPSPSPAGSQGTELKTGISRQSLSRTSTRFDAISQIWNGAVIVSSDIDGKLVVGEPTACPPKARRHRRRHDVARRQATDPLDTA